MTKAVGLEDDKGPKSLDRCPCIRWNTIVTAMSLEPLVRKRLVSCSMLTWDVLSEHVL